MEQSDPDAIAADVVHDGLSVALLGGFNVTVGGRAIAPTAWRLRKAGHLLKLLALAPQHRLHREQVLDTLWPHLDLNAAGNNLRVTLHFARKLLDPEPNGSPGALQMRGDLLILFPNGPVHVDVNRFELLAQAASRSDDPADYAAALDLYGGELLPDDRFEQWAIERRESLLAVHLTLLQNLARLREERGESKQAIEALRDALSDDPASEPVHLALMRLYARTGQRAKALRQYQVLRELLQRELDIEPEPETTRLYESILTGTFDAGHTPSTPLRRTRPATLHAVPHEPRTNLPVQLTSFIGREQAMAALCETLASTRLVTLTGPGGSGKTRLAIEVSGTLRESYRDGVWLVDLTGLTDAALVPQAVASALQIQEGSNLPLADMLSEALAGQQALIVFDNCEHLVVACAELVDGLLRNCPGLRILATSREPLRVPGEVVWPVPALAVPQPETVLAPDALERVEAIQLFIERARLTVPNLTITSANAAAIVAICYRLDGLPLAIELAAARVRALPLAQIADRLDDALRLLTTGSRIGPLHHRSLRAAIEWSYDLLDEPEQRLLDELTVFSGGFTFDAAELVCAGNLVAADQVIDLLFRLMDKSLVIVEEHDGETRYRLLETIRQFGAERLEAGGESEATRNRHAGYFLRLAEQVEPRLLGPDQRFWQSRLAREHDNLRTALLHFLERGDASGARMAGSLYMFWWYHGFLSEGLSLVTAFLAWPAQALPDRDRARVLATSGLLACWKGRHEDATNSLNAALTIWNTLEDQRGASLCHLTLGIMAVDRGSFDDAEAILETGLALARTYREDAFGAMMLDSLSNNAVYRGDPGRALSYSMEAIDLARRAGDPGTHAHALINLADIRFRLNDLRGAMEDGHRGLALARELDERRPTANALNLLGKIALAQGAHDAAICYSRESLALARSVEDPMATIYALSSFAQVADATGQPAPAARLMAAIIATRESLGAPLRTDERDRFDPLIAGWRSELGDDVFSALWAAGQALNLEQAVTEALALDLG